MKLFKKKTLPIEESSQDKLSIRAIDQGYVVTNDDYLVRISKVDAINTELMSENELFDLYEENEAFLKAIGTDADFQIKIVSEPINLISYIQAQEELLEDAENSYQRNLLGGVGGYIEYMKGMDESRQTFRRQRYIIIREKILGYTETDFERAKEILRGRTQGIINGFKQMKLTCELLTDAEIFRYFHVLFNYEHALHERIIPERLQNIVVGERGFRTLRPKINKIKEAEI